MTPSERHNALAPDLLRRIVKETESEGEALVVLESVMVGVISFYARANGRSYLASIEMLDAVTDNVVRRLK